MGERKLMSRLCHWYQGKPSELGQNNSLGRNPLWADYQVLGPSFGAVSMLLGTKDITPVFVNARGCAFHIRFTKFAWGPDFKLTEKPIPYLDFSRTQVVSGRYVARQDQIQALRRITERKGTRLIVLLAGDAVALSGDSLEELSNQLETSLSIPAPVLRISGLSGANPWVGYDSALEAVYEQVWDTPINEGDRQGVNLVGWKWPSREREHDVGVCLNLLQQLGVTVNHVLPGGASLADFADSLRSRANLLWCSSYIGPTLERLDAEKGLKLAGHQPPYGFEGTMLWIEELAKALEDPSLVAKGRQLADGYRHDLEQIRRELKGKRVFVSGGPGRLMGLLHMMSDFEVELVAVALYWLHPESRQNLERVLNRFPKQPETLIISPSLYELEEIAQTQRPDAWLGGYQELHACKKYQIPFVPTTLYLKSHQAFEGAIHLGRKIIQALAGYDFVANPFVLKEAQC
jgi:nitrogenase molybdenum-iron protein alpha/beta subunit